MKKVRGRRGGGEEQKEGEGREGKGEGRREGRRVGEKRIWDGGEDGKEKGIPNVDRRTGIVIAKHGQKGWI